MSDLERTLSDLHRELADARELEPAQRQLLEAALGDIQRALAQSGESEPAVEPVPPADALEGAAVRLETGHPALASAVRAFVDALAKAGI